MSSLSEKDGIDFKLKINLKSCDPTLSDRGITFKFLRYVNLAILQMAKFTLFYILYIRFEQAVIHTYQSKLQ